MVLTATQHCPASTTRPHLRSCPPLTDDIRHDVYLTLSQGVFNKGTKRADKNVQIDVEVLNDKDQVIQVSDVAMM